MELLSCRSCFVGLRRSAQDLSQGKEYSVTGYKLNDLEDTSSPQVREVLLDTRRY